MNAVTQDIFHKADELSADVRQPFPASRKIYVGGGNGIRVPMREISLSATKTANGIEPNPSVTVYDTSGPYSDPDVKRSEEHTSELQSLMRISYAVFCLQKKYRDYDHNI